MERINFPGVELNSGLPHDMRVYSTLYHRGFDEIEIILQKLILVLH